MALMNYSLEWWTATGIWKRNRLYRRYNFYWPVTFYIWNWIYFYLSMSLTLTECTHTWLCVFVCVCVNVCVCICVCLYVCACMLCSWMHAYINIKIISNNNASHVTVFITFHCFISSHSPNESWSSVIFLQLMKCGFFLRNLFYSLAWFPFCWPVPLKFPGIFFTWLIQLS